MGFIRWANRKSGNVVEAFQKLFLAITIFAAAVVAFIFSGGLDQLERLAQPRLDADICANSSVAGIVRRNFVSAYNQQAWFGHFLPQDVMLTRPSASNINSEIERVSCVGWIAVGTARSGHRQVNIEVEYSVHRESGSNTLVVETLFRGVDFMGRGLDQLDRDGRVSSQSSSKE